MSAINEAIDVIVAIHERWQHDWQEKPNWGPKEIDEASLDLHAEMARNLTNLIVEPESRVKRAHLMCCWITLGSMIESAMTFFLCVYVHDHYKNYQSVNAVKAAKEPNENKLYKLRHIFKELVWLPEQEARYDSFVEQVREKRNQIHSFTTTDLGTMAEFHDCVVKYRDMIDEMDGQLLPSTPDYDWR